MDEVALEEKTFGPGRGELFSGSGRTFEANAVTVPIDAIGGAVPKVLHSLSAGAVEVFDAARSKDWRGASDRLARITGAWAAFRTAGTPKLLAAEMGYALDRTARSGRGAKRSSGALFPLST